MYLDQSERDRGVVKEKEEEKEKKLKGATQKGK